MMRSTDRQKGMGMGKRQESTVKGRVSGPKSSAAPADVVDASDLSPPEKFLRELNHFTDFRPYTILAEPFATSRFIRAQPVSS